MDEGGVLGAGEVFSRIGAELRVCCARAKQEFKRQMQRKSWFANTRKRDMSGMILANAKGATREKWRDAGHTLARQ